MIDSAERTQISCSLDRPPKTTPTRILLTTGNLLPHVGRFRAKRHASRRAAIARLPRRLIKTVVRRLLGDEDPVHVAFALARRADLDEARAAAQTRQLSGTDVAHPVLQAAD